MIPERHNRVIVTACLIFLLTWIVTAFIGCGGGRASTNPPGNSGGNGGGGNGGGSGSGGGGSGGGGNGGGGNSGGSTQFVYQTSQQCVSGNNSCNADQGGDVFMRSRSMPTTANSAASPDRPSSLADFHSQW